MIRFYTLLFSLFLFIDIPVKAQLTGCPSNTMYLHYGTGAIGQINLTNNAHSMNTISTPATAGGLAFGDVNGILPSPTFFTVNAGVILYYNGSTWVSTGHSSGSGTAINITAGGGYLYLLDGLNGRIYRYNGTGNAVQILTVPTSPGPFDLASDIDGNFYFLRTSAAPYQLTKYSPTGAVLCTWSVTGMNGISSGGGFGFIGDRLYAEVGGTLYRGTFTATTVNFTSSAVPGGIASADMASCPLVTPITSFVSHNVLSCTVLSLQVTVSPPNILPATYQWSGPGVVGAGNTQTVTVNQPGLYTVIVTPQGGCPITKTINVPGASAPVVTASLTQQTTCAGNTGSVVANVTGGTAPYSYVWNTGATSASISNLAVGTYTVTVTDGTGCSSNSSVNVTSASVPINVSISLTSSISCNGRNDGVLTGAVSGGQAPFTYSWSNGSSSNSASNLVAGTYTLTVTDAIGCIGQATYNLGQPNVLTSSISLTQAISCNGGNNGSITAAANGGTAPYSYVWNTGATSPSINSLTVGNYTVTVTDARGCVSSSSYTITEPTALTVAQQNSQNVLCNGGNSGSITVAANGGTAPYSYAWNDPSAQTTVTASNLTAGSYTVTVTDNQGCSTTGTYTVAEPTALTVVQQASQNVLCNGGNSGSVTVAANGGTVPYSYVWNDPSAQTTATASNLTAGSYTVTVTDNQGCTTTGTYTITEPTVLTVAQQSSQNVLCNGGNSGSITVVGNGGTAPYSYVWNDPSAQTTATASNLTAGSYTVTVTDNQGCSTTGAYTIAEPTVLTVAQQSSQNVLCNGGNSGSITVVGNGGTAPYSYVWNDPSAQTTATASNLAVGTYAVTITDNQGCTTTGTYTITEPTVLTVAQQSSQNVLCNGGNSGLITVVGNGGTAPYSYVWNDPSAQTTATASNLAVGTYAVTITDNQGCTTTGTYTITEPTALTVVQQTSQNVLCNGGNSGSVTVAANGGTVPYSYVWNDPSAQTTATASNLTAGSYTVTVTDNQGCTTTGTYTITEPTQLVAQLTSVQDVLCSGGNNGSISINVTGGVLSYTFLWDDANAQTTQNVANLAAGSYNVIVTDNHGCTTQVNGIVNQPAILSCSIAETNSILCNGNSSGELSVTVTGGVSGFLYAWDDPLLQTTAVAVGLTAGNYTVQITDNNSCRTNCSYTISEPSILNANLNTKADVTCNGLNDGNIHVVATGGTPGYSYLWNDPNAQTNAIALNLSAGAYAVTITDANGCTFVFNESLTEPGLLTGNYSLQQDILCFGDANGSIATTINGGVIPYTYLWNTGASTSGLNNISAGNYNVVVTDANGCVLNLPIFGVSQPSLLQVVATSAPQEICLGDMARIAAAASGGVGNYTYSWSPDGLIGSQHDVAPSFTTQYQVIATDANGCVASAVTTVVVHPLPIANFTFNQSYVTTDNSLVVMNNTSSGETRWIWDVLGNYYENESSISYEFLDSGTYCVNLTAISNFGCRDSVINCIRVLPGYSFYIPNTFTPNDDKLNPVFIPKTLGVESFQMEIFNRWGEKVFESIDVTIGWNGIDSTTGEYFPQGVYVYKIRVKDYSAKEHDYLGNVNLIK